MAVLRYSIGGTLKRLATKSSLQRPYNEQILTKGQISVKPYHFIFEGSVEWVSSEKFNHYRV